jgi:hypothetical protein
LHWELTLSPEREVADLSIFHFPLVLIWPARFLRRLKKQESRKKAREKEFLIEKQSRTEKL